MDPDPFLMDLGPQILDPMDPGRIWILLEKTDLDRVLIYYPDPDTFTHFYNIII